MNGWSLVQDTPAGWAVRGTGGGIAASRAAERHSAEVGMKKNEVFRLFSSAAYLSWAARSHTTRRIVKNLPPRR